MIFYFNIHRDLMKPVNAQPRSLNFLHSTFQRINSLRGLSAISLSLLLPATQTLAQTRRSTVCDQSQAPRSQANIFHTNTGPSNSPGQQSFFCHNFNGLSLTINHPSFQRGADHAMPVDFLTINPKSLLCEGSGLTEITGFSFATCLFFEAFDPKNRKPGYNKLIFRPSKPYRKNEPGWPILGTTLAFSSAQSDEIVCKSAEKSFVRAGIRYFFSYQSRDPETKALKSFTLSTPLVMSRGVKVVPCTPFKLPVIRRVPVPASARETSLPAMERTSLSLVPLQRMSTR